MIKKLQNTVINFIKSCGYATVKTSVFLAVVFFGCLFSFLAGWLLKPAPKKVGGSEYQEIAATPSDAARSEGLTKTPTFLFPPVAIYSDTEPANAVMMQPDHLNLAWLYEEGDDTSQPSDSMAGKLYKNLAFMDAQWISGIYDLYNYTPEQAAALLGLSVDAVTAPSGVIEDFKNIEIQFYNGDGQKANGVSNVRSIISMASTLHYYGALITMEDLEFYASKLWENSHDYKVYMDDVYYCDDSCLLEKEMGNVEEEATNDSTYAADMTGNGANAAQVTEATIDINQPGSNGQTQTSDNDGPEQVSDASSGSGEELDFLCPGHVDLSIHIIIKGISESANLYEADLVQTSLRYSGGNWHGWNETTKGWVDALNSQDWYGLYGINTSDLLMSNPLTSAEIDIYMELLPDDASPLRKAFVKYALSSVGKIPYYWGGKPSAPGYTGNEFGSVIRPDEDGRFLRGLDCSGWVNWVYWSVTGRGLGAESTGTLINSGSPISKSALIPGDICIRTGPVGHVVIFLGWTSEGKMLCIQETTGSANNVEIGIVASDWHSYRRIID